MDPYINPDLQTQSTVLAMIARLEDRGQHPTFRGMIDDYAAAISRTNPNRVLDLGCGTGVVTRLLEAALPQECRLYGADVSEQLLAAARVLSPGSRITWENNGRGPLPYADGYFDAITMHTLLSHVPEVAALLQEAARVLRPGGVLIVCDADHASTTYGLPDYAEMREIDHLLTSAIATHPDICRQLPRLLKEAGLSLQKHTATLLSECGHGDYWLSSVRGFARMMPALQILQPARAEAWVAQMMQSHEDGTFFASGAFYTYYATR